MKTTIVTRQTEVPEELKPIIESKLAKYDKYFHDDVSATVKLSRLRGRERVEITITSGGTIYRGEESDSTFRNALDLALESIERQLRKNKTRLEKRLRAGALSDLYAAAIPPEEPEAEDDEIIIRTKSFALKPMTPEEAILQMNLLGHSFFVFADSQSGEANVVYRRNDGDYGLIVPTV
ncbi:MAG: ribosome-associated translation inhibitor RaiA [Clostridiales bacterium]|nr:ribosome-associated translation inhibitor RaiA [Clostridiales bacterium]